MCLDSQKRQVTLTTTRITCKATKLGELLPVLVRNLAGKLCISKQGSAHTGAPQPRGECVCEVWPFVAAASVRSNRGLEAPVEPVDENRQKNAPVDRTVDGCLRP